MLSRCPRYAPRVINVVFHKIVEQSLSYRTICRRDPGIIFEILSLVVSAPVPIVIQPGGNIGVRQAGVVHILINRWGPVFRAVPSPHLLHVRYHKNSLFNPKTYGNMRLIRSILTRYCIRKKAFNAKLRQKLNNFLLGQSSVRSSETEITAYRGRSISRSRDVKASPCPWWGGFMRCRAGAGAAPSRRHTHPPAAQSPARHRIAAGGYWCC